MQQTVKESFDFSALGWWVCFVYATLGPLVSQICSVHRGDLRARASVGDDDVGAGSAAW
jgi:hypothetical protein